MKKILELALLAVVCCCGRRASAEDFDSVLLWMVADPENPLMVTDFDGSQYMIKDLVGRGEAAGMNVNAARVTAISGSSSTRLRVKTVDSAEWSSAIALPDEEGDYYAGPAWADLSGLDLAGNPDLSFMIELGYFDGVDWFTLAASETESSSALRDYIRPAQLSQYGQLEWTPAYYVPEPNSALLALLGFGFLALRRKNAAHA